MLSNNLLKYVGRIFRGGHFMLFILAVIFTAIPLQAKMVTASKIPGFTETFGITDVKTATFTVQQVESSIPSNILWPEHKVAYTLQITNTGATPLVKTGKIDVVSYGTRGRPDDIWVPDMFKLGDAASVPVDVNIPAKGFVNIKISPEIPAKFGAYGSAGNPVSVPVAGLYFRRCAETSWGARRAYGTWLQTDVR